ncbi:hypothetical protein PAESOLCIP111_06724 [Paenibacillus solanacearum]|uniref:Uncharacterized protein n=1 Tax=Paenibacillus solanacearum TaxID=2048548 RepID=A0A916K9Q4_9BACL|nr:hypothetical protein [Paenibacillus solanacearum]CAG7653223.1 hypothetical protein PAESOLCIP111_06724 [Paenibacillus solanacearum]
MKLKKAALVLASVAMLTFGVQNASATEVSTMSTNITEWEISNGASNSDFNAPERFLRSTLFPVPGPGIPGYTDQQLEAINPIGYNKLGKLNGAVDHDYYLLTVPSSAVYPGSFVIVTLVSPTGYKYELNLTTESGSPIYPKEWLVDDNQVAQVKIPTEYNQRIKLHVSTFSSTVSQDYYQLSISG